MNKKILLLILYIMITPIAFGGSLRETPVVRAVAKATPAVVNVSTEIVTRQAVPFGGNPFFDNFFRDFFGDFPQRERTSTSLGTGVIIDETGHILTNEHVIRNATKIFVTVSDDTTYEAKLVGADTRTDLAVLSIIDPKEKLPFIPPGRSDDLMIGEPVIAIGNPFGLSHTVTTGVVSAINRTIRGGDGRTYSQFIQTDASINPGNSGGPLLNIEGTLIGINTAIYQSAEGIGFAIPIDKARRIIADLVNYGEVHRAWLGLQVQELDADLAQYYGMESVQGVLVRRVFDSSPAARQGVKRGDLLLKIDGGTITSRSDYLDRLSGFTAGSSIKIVLKTVDGEKEVAVIADEIPESYVEELARDWLGVKVVQNSEALARRYRLVTSAGMVIEEVLRQSPAGEAGLRPDDIIRKVNDQETETEEAFKKALLAASHHDTVVLVVQRGRVAYHVSLNP